MTFYIAQEGKETFELTESQFREAVFSGEILPTDHYFCEGMKDWTRVADYRRAGATIVRSANPSQKTMRVNDAKQQKSITLDAQTALGFVGSLILFLGVFAPVVSVPIAGTMNYFQNGLADGLIVMIAGLVSGIETARRKFWHLWISGGLALGCVLFTFALFEYNMHKLRQTMSHDLSDNPFAGLAELAVKAVQLQWGLPVLAVGAGMILVAAAIGTGRLQIRRS
ncbi:MAG TPA: hypothetical protein VJ063_15210 [Verrucomicrobiae bacterium]|nr:hypothetical protein [Verrucomicrobiae bacterium]